jgi:hypothetical protein
MGAACALWYWLKSIEHAHACAIAAAELLFDHKVLYLLACCMWSKARDWSLPIGLFSPPAHALSCRALKVLAECHDAAICDSIVSMYHTQRRISLSWSGHSPWKRAVAGVAMFVFQQRRARMHECAHSAIPHYTHVCQRNLFSSEKGWFVPLFLRCLWWCRYAALLL